MADNTRLLNRAAFEKLLKQAADQAVGNVYHRMCSCESFYGIYYKFLGRKVS